VSLKKILVGAALVFIGLPVTLVLLTVATVSILNRTNGAFVSSGQKREYLLYVPPGYDAAKPTPLVISLHGAATWPAQQRNLSGWNRLADEHGFIVVYPSGTDHPRIWHAERGPGLERDVRFISELIDRLEASYNIDRTRIYADGFSNGGGMAFVLSCTLSDRIAAVGMVAAAQLLPFDWCTDRRPVPMIAFHGTADKMAPYDGGFATSRFAPTKFAPGPPYAFPSVPGWAESWAKRNQCEPEPTNATVAADVTRREYTHCAGDAAVVLYTVQGGGHQWPGGKPMPRWMVGPASRSIDATSAIWTFFSEHPLRER
jgi:polyhydroxybutyrate depolymerase